MKKIWNMIGAAVGVIVFIMGIIFAFTPANSYSTDTADSATFGADFYTYQYKATKIAAQNTAVTANNIREVGEKLALYAGMAFAVAGCLITIHFLKELSSEPKAVPQAMQPVAAVPQPVQPVQAAPQVVVAPAAAPAEEENKLPEI